MSLHQTAKWLIGFAIVLTVALYAHPTFANQTPAGDELWSFAIEDGTASSPAIAPDGTIYVGSDEGNIHAIHPDGSRKWVFETDEPVGSPAIGPQGAIYAGSEDGILYAINRDGTEKWRFETAGPVSSAPAIGPDGTIYIGTGGFRGPYLLHAIRPNGTEKWALETSGAITSSPAMGADGTIHVGSDDGTLTAIRPDGTRSWTFEAESGITSSPAIDVNGTIYVGSDRGNLYAVYPDGTQKWAFSTGDSIESSPAIGAKGTIYVGSNDSKLYAINPNGTQKWTFGTAADVSSSPALGADGTVYVGSFDKRLYAIRPDGTEKWAFKRRGIVDSAPVIGTDGTVYVSVGAPEDKVYAVSGTSGGLGDTPWPMFGHDRRHTGFIPTRSFNAAFTADPSRGQVPLTVRFNAASSRGPISPSSADEIVRYEWDFGDGETANGIQVEHTYETKGRFIATLTATTEQQRTQTAAITIAVSSGTQKWAFETEGSIVSSPAIGPNGTVYVGSGDGSLYSVQSDGTQSWTFQTKDFTEDSGKGVDSSPAIGPTGTVYVGSDDGNLYAINPDGTRKWVFNTGGAVTSSPAVGADGMIYVGSSDGNLYAVTPDGSQKWAFETERFAASPAVARDGTIYVGSGDTNLYALNPDGTQKWAFDFEVEVDDDTLQLAITSPSIGPKGTIYIGAGSLNGSQLYALNPDGTQKWAFDFKGDVAVASPAIGPNGTIYIGSGLFVENGQVFAIHPDGTEKWRFETDAAISSTPAIGEDGTVYVGSDSVYAINPNGTEKWAFETGESVSSSPVIVPDGTLYVGSNDNNLYAIATASGGLADTPWPMFHHNRRHTGRSPTPGPNAAFTADPTSGEVPLTVQFDASASMADSAPPSPDEAIVRYAWDFGDGETGRGVQVEHTYEAQGRFTATLTVTDGAGRTDTFSTSITVSVDGTKRWSVRTGDQVAWSPAIADDGTIYVGSNDGRLYAVGPDGSTKWTFDTGFSEVPFSPVIASDGTVYIGTGNLDEGSGRLFALTPDGTQKWAFDFERDTVASSPAIGPDGTIYVGSWKPRLYAINPDGTQKWTTRAKPLFIFSSPAVAADGTIYVGAVNRIGAIGKLYAFRPNGEKKWTFGPGSAMPSSPAIGADGTVYVGSSDQNLYAVNPDGTEKWAFEAKDIVLSSPAVGEDGTVYVGAGIGPSADDTKLYAINPDGTEQWAYKTEGAVESSPAVGADGAVYVGSNDGHLYAVNPDGTEKWAFATAGQVRSSPVIAKDGTVYVGSDDSRLYAVIGSSGGLADTPWPMFGQNPRHTGRALDAQNADRPSPNAPPEASFSADPTRGQAPLTVRFDASASSDPDSQSPGEAIVSYAWDFGDGESGSGVQVEHTYEAQGQFTATLTVTDAEGQTDTASATIRVSDAETNCTTTVSPDDSFLSPDDSIQNAIDAAADGAVICLRSGTWNTNLTIGKSLTLRGAGQDESTIEGGPVIQIESETEVDVVVERLTVTSFDSGIDANIDVRGQADVTLRNATVTARSPTSSGTEDKPDGILLKDAAEATISTSTIERNKAGISLQDSSQATLRKSTIQNNTRFGIYATSSASVQGSGNRVSGNCPDLAGNVSADLRAASVTQTESNELSFPGTYVTLQKTVDAVAPGGTVTVAPGTHEDCLTLAKPLTLQGKGSDEVTLEGTVSLIDGGQGVQINGVTITDSPLSGLLMYGRAEATMIGSAVTRNEDDGIQLVNASQVTIRDSSVAGNGGFDTGNGISVADSAQAIVRDSSITEHGYGVAMRDSAQVEILNSTVSNGLRLRNASQATLRQSTFRGNDAVGISIADSAEATLRGSTVIDSLGGLNVEDSAQATLANNTIEDNERFGIRSRSSEPVQGSDNRMSGNCPDLMGDVSAKIRAPLVPQTESNELSFPGPYDSLQATIDAVPPSGTVAISPGVQPTCLTLGKPLALEGSPDGVVKILGVVSLVDEAQGVEIQGVEIAGSPVGGLLLNGSAEATIIDSSLIRNRFDGIQLFNDSQATIQDSTVAENDSSGIVVEDAAEVTLRNSTIRDNGLFGIRSRSNEPVQGRDNRINGNCPDLAGNLSPELRTPAVPQTESNELSFPGPYDSLQETVDAVAPGGTVTVAPGSHQGCLTLGKRLTLEGAGADEVTLEGPVSLISGAQGAEIAGVKIANSPVEGVLMGGRVEATLRDSTVASNFGSGIVIEDAAEATLRGLTVEGNGWLLPPNNGILVGDTAQVTLRNNVIRNNGKFGLVLLERPCEDSDVVFQGLVTGRANRITGPDASNGNGEGAVCPSPELDFLTTEEGGEYSGKSDDDT